MRPKLWHHILTGLSGFFLLGTTVFAVIRYGSLDEIPTHFNGAGVADAFGHKSSLVMLIFLAWMLFGVLSAVAFLPPDVWNVPKRSPRTLAAAADMIAVMKLVTVLMFCWMILCSVLGRNLGRWFLPTTMVGMFAPLVHLIIASVRK